MEEWEDALGESLVGSLVGVFERALWSSVAWVPVMFLEAAPLAMSAQEIFDCCGMVKI